MNWSAACWLSLVLITAVPAGAVPCRARVDENPLDGRVVVLENGLVEARVAPQLGGRLMALGRVGAPSLIRNEADYSQTKEAIWARGASADLSNVPADARVSAEGSAVAAVRMESVRTLGQARVLAVRDLAVVPDVPAVFFRLTFRNVGETPVAGLGYALRPHFRVGDAWSLEADERLDAGRLRDSATDLRVSPRRLSTGETDLCFAFPDTSFRLRGLGYMFRLEHAFTGGDLALGESRSFTGAWWLLPAGQAPPERVQVEWPKVETTAAIRPLVVPDAPPADLPRTPFAQGRFFGLCGGAEPANLPLWQAAGVRWIRAGFGWGACEPAPGSYDFAKADTTLAAAEDAGVALVGLLHGAPGWATRGGKSISPPRDPATWERYVETVTRRYRGRVQVWEIWNEPDIGEFWSGTVDDYAALLRAAYAGAKRGNPECLVMSAGLDGPGERFLLELARQGALAHCDLVGFHPYASSPAAAEARLRAVWRILNYYRLRKPVWVTEVGWQSGGWRGGPGVVESEEKKAENLVEAYRRLRPLAEGVAWYVAKEAGRMYGLVQPAEGGLLLNPAYLRYREAALDGERGAWKITGPAALAARAGETTKATWQVKNASGKALDLRVSLHEAQAWVQIEAPERVPAGGTASVKLTLGPPTHVVPGTLPCVLVARTPRGPAAAVPFTLEIANEGDSCAVEVRRRWAMALDEKGAQAGSWMRPEQLVTAPGGRRRQAAMLVNRGSAAETFRLEAAGPAGAWATVAAEVEVPPRGERHLNLDVHVPEGTAQGTYPLALKITCKRHPDVTAEATFTVQVSR